MVTAASVITNAMRLYGILDQEENPTPTDLKNNVVVLNNLLRTEHMGGAAQYLMTDVYATVPAGVAGQLSKFVIGTAQKSYLVQVDAVAVRALYGAEMPNVNRETTMSPTVDVVRTLNPGIITKWRQRRQIDGSIEMTVWQPPRVPSRVLMEIAGRVPPITAADGSDTVGLPPEGIHDAELLLGRRIFSSYGRKAADVALILTDSEHVHARWQDWARGQQWLRMVRS